MDKRLLTPAEAVLLLAPSGATAKICIQAGLLSLLDSGHIAIEPSRGGAKQSTLLLTEPGAPSKTRLPSHLAVLKQALASDAKGDRLTAAQVVAALHKRFGHDFARYVHREVAPSLMARALLARHDSKWLGLFPRTQYQRLPPGDDLAAPLERLMVAVDRMPSLIRTDPEQAVRLARSAGVLLILSPRTRRTLSKLRKLLADRGDAGELAYVPLEGDRVPRWERVLELGDMALAFDLASLFDGLDAVGDFTSGADGGSSDGGGDGGGGGD